LAGRLNPSASAFSQRLYLYGEPCFLEKEYQKKRLKGKSREGARSNLTFLPTVAVPKLQLLEQPHL
jgi:hypothetical protein